MGDPTKDIPPKELKIRNHKQTKSPIEEPPELELKDLPPHLEYAFLEGTSKLPNEESDESEMETIMEQVSVFACKIPYDREDYRACFQSSDTRYVGSVPTRGQVAEPKPVEYEVSNNVVLCDIPLSATWRRLSNDSLSRGGGSNVSLSRLANGSVPRVRYDKNVEVADGYCYMKSDLGCGKHNEQPDLGCQRFQMGCQSAGRKCLLFPIVVGHFLELLLCLIETKSWEVDCSVGVCAGSLSRALLLVEKAHVQKSASDRSTMNMIIVMEMHTRSSILSWAWWVKHHNNSQPINARQQALIDILIQKNEITRDTKGVVFGDPRRYGVCTGRNVVLSVSGSLTVINDGVTTCLSMSKQLRSVNRIGQRKVNALRKGQIKIDMEAKSRKSPTAELFEVDSGRISIRHCRLLKSITLNALAESQG
ncbi:hypothetical protein Tco_0330894 [Tanacetum coccineum]